LKIFAEDKNKDRDLDQNKVNFKSPGTGAIKKHEK